MNIVQSPGKIFLADDLGFKETKIQQRYSVFNFDDHQSEHREPFGILHTFNEEILSAGSTIQQQAQFDGFLILMPITGAISYRDKINHFEADAGQALVMPLKTGDKFSVTNLFPANWVSYIRLEVKCDVTVRSIRQFFEFDLEDKPGALTSVVNSPSFPFKIKIARLNGREEIVHEANGNNIFCFVLAGAFELQNRLLHERDAIALWDVETLEAEALSNNALLLLVELPANKVAI